MTAYPPVVPSSPRAHLILPVLLATLLAAQALPEAQPPAIATVSVGATVVTIRGSERDEAVGEQIRRVLPDAIRAASRWGSLPAAVVLTVHATHGELESATRRGGNPWMRAWARIGAVDLQSPRTWSRGFATDDSLRQILAHELTHCALFVATGRDGRAREIPLWFLEGMASVAAGEHHDAVHADAVRAPGPMLRVDPRLVYGTADRAFRELLDRAGVDAVRRIVARLGDGLAFPVAFRDAVGVPLADFEGDLVGRLSALAVNR